MKWKVNNKYFRWGLTAFIVIILSICFYYLMFNNSDIRDGLHIISNILSPIVMGLVTAWLLAPVLNFLEYRFIIPVLDFLKWKKSSKRDSFSRAAGVTITLTLVILLIYALIAMMLSQIIPSIANIINNFDSYATNFTNWLNKILADNPEVEKNAVYLFNRYSAEAEEFLNDFVLKKSSNLIRTVSMSTINGLKVLWNFIIGMIISIYVLTSKEKFAGQAKKISYAVFEKNTANILINNFRFAHRTFIGFVSGKVVDSIIIGILCFIGTTMLKTPFAMLVSVIIGVTNVIPFFGPYLGAIPSVLLIFVLDPLHPLNVVYFVIFILILQQFDGNILGPKILGNSTGLTGFWVIFAITLFGGLLGIMGMIIGVPFFAVIYAAIRSFVTASLEKKKMPLNTEDYINVAEITDQGIREYVPDYKRKRIKDKNGEEFKNPYGTRFISSFDEPIVKNSSGEPLTFCCFEELLRLDRQSCARLTCGVARERIVKAYLGVSPQMAEYMESVFADIDFEKEKASLGRVKTSEIEAAQEEILEFVNTLLSRERQ